MNNKVQDGWERFDFSISTVESSQTKILGGNGSPHWPGLQKWSEDIMRDHVVAVIMNEAEDVLVLADADKDSGWSSWQMLGGALQTDEDPLSAVQRALRNTIGYESLDWVYLGTFVVDDEYHMGVNHFFLARQARPIDTAGLPATTAVEWVSPEILRTAILDGRIALINHAMTIALALLTVLR